MKCPACQAENLPDSRFCHKCATPLPKEAEGAISFTETLQTPLFEIPRGTLLAGRYDVIEELGKGGMGRVYKVYDQKLKEVVALKLIKPEIGLNEKAIERFRNELKFARKISHRNVCRMYDLGEEGFTHFITMEYVEGEDLKRFIKRSGELTIGKAVRIAKQVCEGLAEAHHLGVTHRDLKPQNIMIDREGNARIMDFGIARFLEVEGLTGSGVMVGTPEYMSPEQVELKAIDQRSDIYSLGIILYEMVTGRVPFEGETPLSIAMKHKSEKPKNPQELNPHVSADLARVIAKCLEKEKEKRYQRAEDFLADLNLIEKGLPTVEKAISKKESFTSKEITVTIRMKKLLIPGLAILAIAVAAIMIWKILPHKENVLPPKQSLQIAEPGKIQIPEILPRAEKPKVEIEPSEKQPSEKHQSSIWGQLSGEVLKYVSQKDLEGFKDAQKLMEGVRPYIPDEGPFKEAWSKAYEKMKEGKKLREGGNFEQAKKSDQQGQMEMQRLMSLVAERQSAQTAKEGMTKAKAQAQQKGLSQKNLLYFLAKNEESNAEDAFAKNDFSGAKTLYQILEKIFRLSLKCDNNENCAQILQAFVLNLKREVEAMNASSLDPWLLQYAAEIENLGTSFLAKRQFDNAAASYIQAAFLYEKVKEKATPSIAN